MKTKSLLLFVPAMCGLLLLQNCGPKGDGCEEHEPVNTYYNISDLSKSKILFSSTDTMVYISINGDSATLYGQGEKKYYEKLAQKWNPDPACPDYDYDYLQHVQYTFKGNHPILKEIIFSAFVDNIKDQNALVSLNSIYKNDGYRIAFINNESRYIDSVNINGVIYYGFTIYSGPTKFLYNWKYGFLSLYIDGLTWKLMK